MGALWAAASAAAVALTLAPGAGAQAQTRPFALDRYEPSPLASDWLRVERPSGLSHGGLALAATLDWARRPLVLVVTDAAGTRRRIADIVASQLFVSPSFAFGLFDRVTFHASLPVAIAQSGEGFPSRSDAGAGSPASSALGDFRFGARVRVLGEPGTQRWNRIALSIGAYVWTPSGAASSWASDGKWRAQPTIIAEVAPNPTLYFTANLGVAMRPDRVVLDVRSGTEAVLAVAGGAKIRDGRLRLGGELTLGTGLQSGTTLGATTTPAEILASGTYEWAPGFFAGLGAGTGLSSAAGTPQLRAVLRAGYVMPTAAPARAAPPPPPPPVDVDHDKDGIPDSEDACPYEPGVPSPDRETNGCPDRDADGIADKRDACPDAPGPRTDDPETNGCPPPPPPDRDGDGIPDAVDACPDVPGHANADPRLNGCPLDTDRDGIPDSDDACPNDPGVRTADPKTNGCPLRADLAEVKDGKIAILSDVSFTILSDKIVGARSFRVLDSVAAILVGSTVKKVRVEGHTDDRGKAESNRAFSQRRADAVKAYLVARGVAAERLESQGFGPDKPLGDNGTEAGRAKNRRVEFVIVEP